MHMMYWKKKDIRSAVLDHFREPNQPMP